MLNAQFQKARIPANNIIGRGKMDELWLEKMQPRAGEKLRSARTPEPMAKFSDHTRNSQHNIPLFQRGLLRF